MNEFGLSFLAQLRRVQKAVFLSEFLKKKLNYNPVSLKGETVCLANLKEPWKLGSQNNIRLNTQWTLNYYL